MLLSHALLSMAPKLLFMSVAYAEAIVVAMTVSKAVVWCTVVRLLMDGSMQHAPVGAEHHCVALICSLLSFSALISALTGAYVWQHNTAIIGLACGISQLVMMPLILQTLTAHERVDDDGDSQATSDSEFYPGESTAC
jgi:hypothetical protein